MLVVLTSCASIEIDKKWMWLQYTMCCEIISVCAFLWALNMVSLLLKLSLYEYIESVINNFSKDATAGLKCTQIYIYVHCQPKKIK